MLLLKLAPLTGCFLLCFLLARLASQRRLFAPDWRLHWILAALVSGALVILVAEISSAFDSFARLTLTAAWTFIDAAVCGLIVWKFRDEAVELARVGAERLRMRLSGRKIASPLPPGERSARWIYGLGLAFALFLGLISYQAPTFIWDCKSYHVPRILNWVQNANLRLFPTTDIRRVAFSPGAEIAAATLSILNGSDRLINLVSWFAVLSSAILAAFLTEHLLQIWAERTGRVCPADKLPLAGAFAFLLVLTIPEGLFQAISTENDFVVALWNFSLAALLLLYLREPKKSLYAAAAGLALALGICSKVTTFITAAPFVAGAFALLACRRLYFPALKLAAIFLVAVSVINAPWWLRNQALFGHWLGPPRISREIVNPSFTPTRDVAGLLRDVSFYTATPSATVTGLLNDALEKLIAATGRPLDDPSSVFPYADPNHATHFYFQGKTAIGNGSGFGNVHAWLILAAYLVLLAWPLRNALGFYAAALLAGFCLSSFYLRWHPWIFRLHISYFVLAAPLVAVVFSLCARRGFIVALSALCLVNALLILAFNVQYPIYAPFLKLTREQHEFGSSLSLHQPYAALADDIIRRGCTNVLLACPTYNFDYGLWVCLQNRAYHGAIHEFLVTNETASLDHWRWTPQTAMVFLGRRTPRIDSLGLTANPQHLLQINYLQSTGALSALFASPFPGTWWRLLQPDNHTQIADSISARIGPDNPAQLEFACQPINSSGRPLTNNVFRLKLGQSIGDFDLRSGPVDATTILTQPSFTIDTFLLDPLSPSNSAAYLSNVRLSWKPAGKPASVR